jgi:type I restriction enzyme M protein
MFQHLMDYWAETMQDDFYELSADGWKAGNVVKRIEKKTKKGDKEIVKQVAGIEGLEGRLIPPALMIQEYFHNEQLIIDNLQLSIDNLQQQMEELREEHSGEDGLLNNAIDDKGKISKGNLAKAIRDAQQAVKEWEQESYSVAAESNSSYGEKEDITPEDELKMLQHYKKLMEDESAIQSEIKTAKAELEKKVIAQYPRLSIDEIKTIVVEKKWMANMQQRIRTEMDNISHRLTQRIKELAERYETPLPESERELSEAEVRVKEHLKKMNFKW